MCPPVFVRFPLVGVERGSRPIVILFDGFQHQENAKNSQDTGKILIKRTPCECVPERLWSTHKCGQKLLNAISPRPPPATVNGRPIATSSFRFSKPGVTHPLPNPPRSTTLGTQRLLTSRKAPGSQQHPGPTGSMAPPVRWS